MGTYFFHKDNVDGRKNLEEDQEVTFKLRRKIGLEKSDKIEAFDIIPGKIRGKEVYEGTIKFIKEKERFGMISRKDISGNFKKYIFSLNDVVKSGNGSTPKLKEGQTCTFTPRFDRNNKNQFKATYVAPSPKKIKDYIGYEPYLPSHFELIKRRKAQEKRENSTAFKPQNTEKDDPNQTNQTNEKKKNKSKRKKQRKSNAKNKLTDSLNLDNNNSQNDKEKLNSQKLNSQKSNGQKINSQKSNGQKINSQKINSQKSNGQKTNSQKLNSNKINSQKAKNENGFINGDKMNETKLKKRKNKSKKILENPHIIKKNDGNLIKEKSNFKGKKNLDESGGGLCAWLMRLCKSY